MCEARLRLQLCVYECVCVLLIPGRSFVRLDLLQVAVDLRQADAVAALGTKTNIQTETIGSSSGPVPTASGRCLGLGSVSYVPLAIRAFRLFSSLSSASRTSSVSSTLCSAVTSSPATSCSTWRIDM